MVEFTGWSEEDFDVFAVPGLELRMDALKQQLRPKLEQLGRDFSTVLSNLLNVPIYAHVAKHARRTVNPPNDSWVAFCTDKRGYKKHPHFQIGAWQTHIFATIGLIYEAPNKPQFGRQILSHLDEVVKTVPKDYFWFPDHTVPDGLQAGKVPASELAQLANRLVSTKQGELLVGMRISRENAVKLTPAEFERKVQKCFTTLKPIWSLANSEVVV